MVQYTFAFDQSDGLDPQRLGGKCASLVALTAAGIPVPPGFAVTSQAYAEFLAVDGLDCRLETLLRRLGSREEAAANYRRALELVTNDSERRYLERRLSEVS